MPLPSPPSDAPVPSSPRPPRRGGLLAGLRGLVAAPEYPGDENRTRRARLFHLSYLFCAAWLIIMLLGGLVGNRIPARLSLTLLVMGALGLVPYVWVRRGRLEAGVTFWLGYCYVAATVGLAMLGTIRAPALGFYLVLVICAGYVFGGRGMIAMVGLSSLAVAGLIVAETRGWLPQPDYRVSVTQWVTATAFFACVGWLTLAAERQIRQSLRRAEQEVAERRRAEAELRETNRRLEEALASVRTLNGLLPLCAWCRKVREDAGYWSALENYVAAHTDATFTHGICPDCEAKHFGGRECRKVE
ncbi:hypothetical protein [Oleiharenicola sp. Vm1]|uniref:hypothetical protein n=1 Tax=Oleiharenicola sp. Vm1 TaxID=3398393 RepID=UPI0039F57805